MLLFCGYRYKKLKACITPTPKVSGGDLKPFPNRLYAIPPRVSSGSIPGVSSETYQDDNKMWKKHVNAYKKINSLLDSGRYRNIMDMNAGLGSFAAAIHSSKSWVMNVVPTIAEKSTLGVIYERGLIGIYHDWYGFLTSRSYFIHVRSQSSTIRSCFFFLYIFVAFLSRCEGFSTYPRTYDLIHANGLFSLYQDK